MTAGPAKLMARLKAMMGRQSATAPSTPSPEVAAGAQPTARAKVAGKPVVEYLPDADEIERSPLPRMAQWTVWLIVSGLLVLLVWAWLARLDLVVSARGRLVNPVPNVVVQPLETAVVQSVDVRPGQTVRKGDLLATLDATFAKADEAQLRARLASLDTQAASLEAELEGEPAEPKGAKAPQADEQLAHGAASASQEGSSNPPNEAAEATGKASPSSTPDARLQAHLRQERAANYRAQVARLNESVGRLRAALASNRQDRALVATRLRSLQDIQSMQEKGAAQKFGTPLQAMEARQRTQEVQRDLELVQNRARELQRELAAAEAEKQAFERGWRQKTLEDLLAVTRERDALREQLDKAERRQSLVRLTAPVDAVVLEIAKLSPGSVVREAETFFTLVPLDVVLEAEAEIDAADIGHLKVGDAVRLKIDAFPFQRHGILPATIAHISQDAYRREVPAPGALSNAYYRVRLRLAEGARLDNLKPQSHLLPGMTLQAEAVVGERSVISYLVWPLTKGLTEAIREP
jgi:HlyD family secretion protein